MEWEVDAGRALAPVENFAEFVERPVLIGFIVLVSGHENYVAFFIWRLCCEQGL